MKHFPHHPTADASTVHCITGRTGGGDILVSGGVESWHLVALVPGETGPRTRRGCCRQRLTSEVSWLITSRSSARSAHQFTFLAVHVLAKRPGGSIRDHWKQAREGTTPICVSYWDLAAARIISSGEADAARDTLDDAARIPVMPTTPDAGRVCTAGSLFPSHQSSTQKGQNTWGCYTRSDCSRGFAPAFAGAGAVGIPGPAQVLAALRGVGGASGLADTTILGSFLLAEPGKL